MEKLDLTKILKEVSQMVFKGEVTFDGIIKIENFPIETGKCVLTADGRYCLNGECMLIPSKDPKDWSKTEIVEEKFDISSLQPFDKVICRDNDGDNSGIWVIDLFSHYVNKNKGKCYIYCCLYGPWLQCVPYNDETKHLIGTTQQAPSKYITWE